MHEGPRFPRASGLEQWRMSDLAVLDVGRGIPSHQYRVTGAPGP